MPDGPMPSQSGASGQPQAGGQQQPPQGGGAPQGQGGGGGIADAIVQLDQMMNKIAQAISQNAQVGNDVKSAWQDALGALRKAEQALVQAAGGGGDEEPDQDDEKDQGTTTTQQGASGAVPVTHASMRGR